MTPIGFTLPRISVVIPVHNCLDFVTRAIASVLSQGYASVEIIVVNDASTDGSAELLREYAGRPNIQILTNGVQRGRSYARNRGARAATGQIIAFLDADDEWAPGHAARISEFHSVSGGESALYVPPVFINELGQEIGKQELNTIGYTVDELILSGEMPYTSGLSFSRKAWEVLPGFDQTLDEREDWRLGIDCVVWRTPIEIHPSGTILVRKHASNHSRDMVRFAAATERVVKAALQAAAVLLLSERRDLIDAKIHAHAALVMMAARQKTKSVRHVLGGARISWRVLASLPVLRMLLRLVVPKILWPRKALNS
jgi:glycosyltransferase involved in cell wall biosynthesis